MESLSIDLKKKKSFREVTQLAQDYTVKGRADPKPVSTPNLKTPF